MEYSGRQKAIPKPQTKLAVCGFDKRGFWREPKSTFNTLKVINGQSQK